MVGNTPVDYTIYITVTATECYLFLHINNANLVGKGFDVILHRLGKVTPANVELQLIPGAGRLQGLQGDSEEPDTIRILDAIKMEEIFRRIDVLISEGAVSIRGVPKIEGKAAPEVDFVPLEEPLVEVSADDRDFGHIHRDEVGMGEDRFTLAIETFNLARLRPRNEYTIV